MTARSGPAGLKAGAAIVVIVVACMCWGIVFKLSKADCEERGGHIEWIYGRHVAWTCDGAAR